MAAVPSIGRATEVQRQQVAAPEADATRTLYERYHRQIYNYCLHQLGNREEAEDAVQGTFLNAFRGFKRGITPEHESAWVFKIAENVCLTRRRASFRRGRVEWASDFQELQDVIPGHTADGEGELMGLTEALSAMPEQQRTAILLREWQGLSYKEIAGEMGLTQGAVETLIFRARRTLAQGLTDPEAKSGKRRWRHAVDVGSLLAGLKTFLGGSAAVKVAATVAVATTATTAGTVVATKDRPAPARPKPAMVVEHVTPVAPRAVGAVSLAPRVASPPTAVDERRAAKPKPVVAKKAKQPARAKSGVPPAAVPPASAAVQHPEPVAAPAAQVDQPAAVPPPAPAAPVTAVPAVQPETPKSEKAKAGQPRAEEAPGRGNGNGNGVAGNSEAKAEEKAEARAERAEAKEQKAEEKAEAKADVKAVTPAPDVAKDESRAEHAAEKEARREERAVEKAAKKEDVAPPAPVAPAPAPAVATPPAPPVAADPAAPAPPAEPASETRKDERQAEPHGNGNGNNGNGGGKGKGK